MSALREELVQIPHAGSHLHGLMHLADRPEDAICVLMFTSGMQPRVGPGRLYLTAARAFAEKGINVVRVDLSGAGDAVGDNAESHFDAHDPQEAESVIKYAIEHLAPRSLIVAGLCAGGRVAIKSARNPAVDGVLAWSVPIFSSSLNMPQSPHEERVSEVVARNIVVRLARFVFTFKWLDPRWWKRAFPDGEGLFSEIKLVLQSALRLVSRGSAESVTNPFFEATESYLAAGRKVLFTYGSFDHMPYQEFRERFPDLEENGIASQGYSVVERGTHTFANHPTQIEAIEHALRWIEHHFADEDGPAAAA